MKPEISLGVPTFSNVLRRNSHCSHLCTGRWLVVPCNRFVGPIHGRGAAKVSAGQVDMPWHAHHVVAGASTRISLNVRPKVDSKEGMM